MKLVHNGKTVWKSKGEDRTPAAKQYFHAFYKNNHLLWAVALFFTILAAPQMMAISWLLGSALDVAYDGTIEQIMKLLWIGIGIILLCSLSDFAMYRTKTLFIHRALAQYKSQAFKNLSEKSISAFSRENTGRYLSVLTNDTGSIEENYLKSTFNIIYQILMLLGALVMMLYYSPLLTGTAIGLSMLPMAASILMGQELTRREKTVSDRNEGFVAQLKDLLGGFSVIKSFKAEGEVQKIFDEANHATERAKLRRRWWDCLVATICGFSGSLVQFGIVILGSALAIKGEITVGTALIIVNLCNCLLQPINYVPQALANRKAAKALVEKLAEITEENAGRTGEAIAPVLNDAIALSHVTFGYEADKPVLRDVSLRLEAGKRYAVVGASGSGKSTLLNLLMGAYDGYEGSITLDGKELRTVDPDSLYDLMSLIGQSVFLFDDTIRRNITMFRDFPDDQVDSAVRRSGLAELLEQRGEDYRCGENGVGLSGGERQRVSIARCLLRGTPVLMLDEATASLDSHTAFAVTDAILHLDGLTRLVVTHRLESALLEQYDEIVVMRGGQICEQGRFQDLMGEKGYFYSLYTVSNG